MMLLIFKTVLLVGYAPRSFMEPTLHKNSFILGLRLHGELKTGDIIIFRLDEENRASGGEQIERDGKMVNVSYVSISWAIMRQAPTNRAIGTSRL